MTGVEPGEGQEAPREPEGPGLAELLSGVLAQFREVAASLVRLADIRVEQARLATRRLLILTALALWFAVVILAATALAVSYAVSGFAGFLAERLGGKIWLADLVTGGILLAAILGVGLAARMSMQRANLRRLRGKFEADPGPPRDRRQPATEESG